jgi:DNA-binding Xre family transcriptional regulator
MTCFLLLGCAKLRAMTTDTKLTTHIQDHPRSQEHVALGQALKLVIAEQQLTQRKLADRTGIDVRRVNAIVLGKANPTYLTLLRLCKELGVTPSALTVRADELLDEQDQDDRRGMTAPA